MNLNLCCCMYLYRSVCHDVTWHWDIRAGYPSIHVSDVIVDVESTSEQGTHPFLYLTSHDVETISQQGTHSFMLLTSHESTHIICESTLEQSTHPFMFLTSYDIESTSEQSTHPFIFLTSYDVVSTSAIHVSDVTSRKVVKYLSIYKHSWKFVASHPQNTEFL